MNIYLIGYRGTGKTSIAPLLANQLGADWTWLDLDAELQSQVGRSIKDLFANEGEAYFRGWEEQILAQVASRNRVVAATGGGVVVRSQNRERLRKGWVVWLTASPETIFTRIHSDDATHEQRPNLTSVGGLEEIKQLLESREPLYRELADLIVATDELTAVEVAYTIWKVWSRESSTQG